MITKSVLSGRIPCLVAMFLALVIAGCRRPPVQADGLLAEAEQQIRSGHIHEARQTLENALAGHPDSLTANVNLGLVCYQLGDLTAAAAAWNRATELAPEEPLTWELLARLLIRDGNVQGAAEVLEKVSRPTATTYTLKALAAWTDEPPEKARKNLEQALEKDRFHGPALYNLAILQRDRFNAPVQALAAYRRFRDAHPKDPRGRHSDEAFLNQTPQPSVAPPSPAQQPDREAVPPSPPPVSAANRVVADTGTRPSSPPAPPSPASPPTPSPSRLQIRKAEQAAAAGNPDEALVLLKDTVQRYPNDADAVWALAVFYDRQLQQKDRAEGLYRTFLQLFPDDPRAQARRAASPPSGSTSSLTGEQWFQKGLDHYQRQDWPAAVNAYRQALALDPKSASCAYNLGLAYKGARNIEAAIAAFRHALKQDPDMIKSLYMLGLSEINRERYADALPPLNRLIRIQPDFAKAHYLLGQVYAAENRPETAISHYERFLRISPDDPAAERVQRWLEQHRR